MKLQQNFAKRQVFKRCVAFTDRNLTKVIQRNVEFYHRIAAEKVVDERDEFMNEEDFKWLPVAAILYEGASLNSMLPGANRYGDPGDILLCLFNGQFIPNCFLITKFSRQQAVLFYVVK